MIFSAYTDPYVDDAGVLHSSVSIVDDSTCYDHWNYTADALISSPDGRGADSGQNYTLYTDAALPLNDVDGDYYVSITGSFNCGCFYGAPTSYFTSAMISLRKTVYSRSNADPCGCDYNVSYGSTTATCGSGANSTSHLRMRLFEYNVGHAILSSNSRYRRDFVLHTNIG